MSLWGGGEELENKAAGRAVLDWGLSAHLGLLRLDNPIISRGKDAAAPRLTLLGETGAFKRRGGGGQPWKHLSSSLGSLEQDFSCPRRPAAPTMCVPAVGHLWPLHQGQGTVGCCVRRGDAVSAAIDVRVPRAGAARGRASLCRRPGLWIVRPLTPGLAAREPSEQEPAVMPPYK